MSSFPRSRCEFVASRMCTCVKSFIGIGDKPVHGSNDDAPERLSKHGFFSLACELQARGLFALAAERFALTLGRCQPASARAWTQADF